MDIDFARPLKLELRFQNYAWGKLGLDSLVARLIDKGNVDKNLPYAELWMGAHPNGCASLILPQSNKISAQIPLSQAFQKYPLQLLGKHIADKFGGELPFLAKILSIAKPLSIQAHPDKKLAKILHARDPKNYPDANHKPEIALAINDVTLLFGFRPISEIKNLIENTPELASLIGEDLAERFAKGLQKENEANGLRAIYRAIVDPSKSEQLMALTRQLINRLKKKSKLSENEKFVLSIYDEGLQKDQVFSDIGIMTSLLMNYEKIEAGKAVFIDANTLHTYLSGDLFECMANSDNVVRGGLTNKFQDIQTLVEMLDYKAERIVPISAQDTPEDAFVSRYQTGSREFLVDQFKTGPLSASYSDNNSIQLIFCLEGAAEVSVGSNSLEMLAGDVCFIPAAATTYSVAYSQATLFRVSVPK